MLDREHAIAESLGGSIAATLRDAALARGEVVPALDQVAGLVMTYLPKLIGLLADGLITRREGAASITDRFVVWSASEAGQSLIGTDASWELVVDEVAAIFHAAAVGSNG